jgi:hypothetical protein
MVCVGCGRWLDPMEVAMHICSSLASSVRRGRDLMHSDLIGLRTCGGRGRSGRMLTNAAAKLKGNNYCRRGNYKEFNPKKEFLPVRTAQVRGAL